MFCCISSKIIALLIGKQNPFCKPPCGGWRIAVNYLQTTIPPTQYRFVQYDLTSPSSLKLTHLFRRNPSSSFWGCEGLQPRIYPWIAGPISEGSGRETPSFTKKQGIPRLHRNSNTGKPAGWFFHTESMRLEYLPTWHDMNFVDFY